MSQNTYAQFPPSGYIPPSIWSPTKQRWGLIDIEAIVNQKIRGIKPEILESVGRMVKKNESKLVTKEELGDLVSLIRNEILQINDSSTRTMIDYIKEDLTSQRNLFEIMKHLKDCSSSTLEQ